MGINILISIMSFVARRFVSQAVRRSAPAARAINMRNTAVMRVRHSSSKVPHNHAAVPSTVFKMRVKDAEGKFGWAEARSDELFKGKRSVLFALPGAFTPTCSSTHLPTFEEKYDEFKALGVDEIYCLSVNDSFVMNAWAEAQFVKKVKMLPDGAGDFTRLMGMLVRKDNVGFGLRSWRYSAFIVDGQIEKLFVEAGREDNAGGDLLRFRMPIQCSNTFVRKSKRIRTNTFSR